MPMIIKIACGSSGNSHTYNDKIMFDAGISFSKLSSYIDSLEIVFISHAHSDHYNRDTIKAIIENKPEIILIGGGCMRELFEELDTKHYILEAGRWYKLLDYEFYLVKLMHNVENYGLAIKDNKNNKRGVYLTDTFSLEGFSFKNLDFAIVEFNHSEAQISKEIERIAHYNENRTSGQKYEHSHLFASRKNHLSMEKSMEWINENAVIGKTEIMLMHISSALNRNNYVLHYVYDGITNIEEENRL